MRPAGSRIVLVFCAILATSSMARPQDASSFYEQYWLAWVNGSSHPIATNARVRQIFTELSNYSHHEFPVYPTEQLTAGVATPQGIYLDVSIAANPDIEVTRFFLAHEWGHMMHGDPIVGKMTMRGFAMMQSTTAAEHNADTYAAAFMRYEHQDITPVLAFICSIPDSGPEDPHGTAYLRARHVAEIFGSPDQIATVPCAPELDANRLENGIRAMSISLPGGLKSVKGPYRPSVQAYESTIKLPDFDGREETCAFDVDEEGRALDYCSYLLRLQADDDIHERFDQVAAVASHVLLNWTASDSVDKEGNRVRQWSRAGVRVRLEEDAGRHPKLDLSFEPPIRYSN